MYRTAQPRPGRGPTVTLDRPGISPPAPSAPPHSAKSVVPPRPSRLTRLSPRWSDPGPVVALAAVATAGVVLASWDNARDQAEAIPGYAGGVGALDWRFGPILVLLAFAHYLAAALAVRAASAQRLGFTEVTLAQFAAAAANRLTPAGIGGVALNTRYLVRRGLPLPEAAGSMAALAVLGPVTDLLLIAGLTGVGYLSGTTPGVGALGATLARTSRTPLWIWDSGWLARGAILGVSAGAAGWLIQRRIARRPVGPGVLSRVRTPLVRLARHPRELLTLLAASTAATAVLGVALAVSMRMVPGPSAGVSLTTVMTVLVVGSAVGSAVPVPAGVGSTEAGLVTALLATGVPATHAVRTVLLFRVVTFWAPPLLGIVTARVLRRRGAL
ncbi:MAG: lysylphosphatidylglycerol synthase transmembrane domain-containing protein [Frankia sp.]